MTNISYIINLYIMNKRINQYEIKETIATGGMATIYRAVQISLGREVVIKKLHPHLAEDANFVRRFKREAAILAKLQHKNIVSIIDFFEDSGDQFIVLEYIKGFTLHDLINSKKNIPFPISMFVLSEVCNGLKYIHSNNILHRDLKPENIMISDEGEIKITDFGLAYRKENMNITNPGTYVGTPAYFPPEQLMGKPLTPAADIFSLAIALVEMMTGKNPFAGEKEFDTINNILYHTSVKLKFRGKKPPSQIERLIYSMLEKKPENRISSCADILQIIEEYAPLISHKDFNNYLNNKGKKRDEYRLTVSISTKRDAYNTIALAVLIFIFAGVSIFQINNYIRTRNPETVIVEVPQKGFLLHIETLPTKTDISINDSITVKTPVNLSLPEGIYTINTADEKFNRIDTSITLHSNDSIFLKLTMREILKTYGFLYVNVIPWADLYIDNEFIDRTPIDDPLKLETGNYDIKLIHPNRKVYEAVIDIEEDQILRIDRELEMVYGYLKIIVKPWANVIIDDSLIGTTPLADTIKLLIGPHRIVLKNPSKDEITDNINISEKEVLRKFYSFP